MRFIKLPKSVTSYDDLNVFDGNEPKWSGKHKCLLNIIDLMKQSEFSKIVSVFN